HPRPVQPAICPSPSPSPVLVGPQKRPQLGRDRFARPEDPGAHCANRTVHHVGNLVVTQALDLAQRNRRAKILGQRLHRLVDGVGYLLSVQLVFRRRRIAQLLGIFKILRLLVIESGRRRCPSSHRDQVVLGGVDRDSVQPRIKRTISAKARQRAVGFDKRLLRHVLDLAGVAHQPRQQPSQLALVLQYQQLEGTLVTPLRTLHQLLIYFAVSHPRAVPESFVIIAARDGGRGTRRQYSLGRP